MVFYYIISLTIYYFKYYTFFNYTILFIQLFFFNMVLKTFVYCYFSVFGLKISQHILILLLGVSVKFPPQYFVCGLYFCTGVLFLYIRWRVAFKHSVRPGASIRRWDCSSTADAHPTQFGSGKGSRQSRGSGSLSRVG